LPFRPFAIREEICLGEIPKSFEIDLIFRRGSGFRKSVFEPNLNKRI
jgi:hypothetical protein